MTEAAKSTSELSDKGFSSSAMPLYLGFAILTGLLLGLIFFVDQQRRDYVGLQRYEEANHLLEKVLGELRDAETGQRGYLLTLERSYLEPYNNATASMEGDFKALATALDGDPTDQSALSAIRSLADEKLTELQTTITLVSAAKGDEALGIVHNGSGKAVMDKLRARVAALNGDFEQRTHSRYSKAQSAENWLLFGVFGALALTTWLAFAFISKLKAAIRAIAAASEDVRQANVRLLAEAQHGETLGEQLRQSQKMEAIGSLTGGIAHDFNNMLAIITSGIGLAKRNIARGNFEVDRFLDYALDGSERAASLTHRLLAFSRQQPLSPIAIQPNKLLSEMSELLRRSLTEGVQLETVLAAGVWRTHADPSQLENAILNLAVNARDAMLGAGKLTIETSNAFLDEPYAAHHVGVPVGQYVLIAVTDTGSGMTPDVVAKAFDPFFTTKPIGLGTGLGLSQVFGFVKQSNGHVKIYSEPGHGTTVKIYLSRFVGIENERNAISAASKDVPTAGLDETILVVEDDEQVRELALAVMKDLGYAVHAVNGAAEALRYIDSGARVDLLFTDVIMPDINGRKLAEEATRRRPGLKVLFTTGFSRNAVVHNGMLDHNLVLIVKPYSVDQLARKVREILDRPGS